VVVKFSSKFFLNISDMPIRKTDLQIEKNILPQLTEGIRIPRAKIFSIVMYFVRENSEALLPLVFELQ
jgi:hypothetical protein